MRIGQGLVVAALLSLAGSASGQGERPPARTAGAGPLIEPVRIAPAVYAGGRVVRVGEWVGAGAAPADGEPCLDERVFECYGDGDFDGIPDDAGTCGMGDARWYFGTGYCGSVFVTNDMTVAPDTLIAEGAWRADLAWYWTCDGEARRQCVIAIFLEDSLTSQCEPDSFDSPGWMVDLGELECAPQGYYRTSIDISAQGRWELPESGEGSYALMFLTDDGDSPAPCMQLMLWGSPNNTGGDPLGPGEQGPMQFEDDGDLVHEPDECVSLDLGLCPDPLGAMAQFWGVRERPRNRADVDGDGDVDAMDVAEFLNRWGACEPPADCDANGLCDTRDLVCYLGVWATCRG